MGNIIAFAKAYPRVMGILVGLCLVAGYAVHRYNDALIAQGAAEQRAVVEASSKVLTEKARTADDTVIQQYQTARQSLDVLSPTKMINDYSVTIVSENKAQRNDPSRKGTSPDRIGRLYDGLCSTYDSCTDESSHASKNTISTVSGRNTTQQSNTR